MGADGCSGFYSGTLSTHTAQKVVWIPNLLGGDNSAPASTDDDVLSLIMVGDWLLVWPTSIRLSLLNKCSQLIDGPALGPVHYGEFR